MSPRCNPLPALVMMLCVLLLFCGCTSIGIGHAGYANNTVSLTITNTGRPSEGYVQVTVFEIKDARQEETGVFYAPLALQTGKNTALVPATLRPGQYKLYIYLIQNGERKAAAIRDIMVN